MILVLESSTCWMSMGLFTENQSLFEVNYYTKMGHSRIIFRYLKTILEDFKIQDQLEALVVGLGPGSFTGVKIASIIGKGLAYALQKPIYGFSTLEAMANQVREDQFFSFSLLVPVIFHKRNEIFWAEFPRNWGKHSENMIIQTTSPQELVEIVRKQEVLIVTPWKELYEYFQKQGLSCYHPLFSLPEARSFANLYFFPRRDLLPPDWRTLFQLVPIYGSKSFR